MMVMKRVLWKKNDDEEHDQLELADEDDPKKDVQGIFESDDVADNAVEDYFDDDTMSVTDDDDDDDDDDMANPYNVDYVFDDIDDDMDEEDNEIY